MLQAVGTIGLGAVAGWLTSGSALTFRNIALWTLTVFAVLAAEWSINLNMHVVSFVLALGTSWTVRYILLARFREK